MRKEILGSVDRLDTWLEANDFAGYDPFDGLNARLLRPFTLENRFLRTVLQQGIRRFPINLRPLVGVGKSPSSKGMGFLARGYLRLFQATGEPAYHQKAIMALDWLIQNQAPGYSGAAWGNHFDYQSRVFYLPRGVPTIVWVALIGHAFLDAYEILGQEKYLEMAVRSCEHILADYETRPAGKGACISYIPTLYKQVHNANVLGASLLARTYATNGKEAFRELAREAIHYTACSQRPDHSWYYGEADNLHWVDNFHTGYVLDSLKHYIQATGDDEHLEKVKNGYRFWKKTFFLPDGTPKFYDYKTKPLDIQCSSQAIDTLVFFQDLDPTSLELAQKVAGWTIKNMQDRKGYFYYRRYGGGAVNKTPTLHWGQATMLCALAKLYLALGNRASGSPATEPQ